MHYLFSAVNAQLRLNDSHAAGYGQEKMGE
jgi:hypothetical protein